MRLCQVGVHAIQQSTHGEVHKTVIVLRSCLYKVAGVHKVNKAIRAQGLHVDELVRVSIRSDGPLYGAFDILTQGGIWVLTRF